MASAISMREFGRAIASHNFRGLVLVLKASFDTSMTETGPGMTAVAGYLGTVDDWVALEKEWQEALDYWGLDRFHLSAMQDEIGREKSELCIKYFSNIIARSNLAATGCVMLDNGWDGPTGFRRPGLLNTRYEACLYDAFRGLADHVREDYEGEEVALICDADAKEQSIQAIFHAAKEANPALVSATVTTSHKCIPLQCADLAVGALRRNWLQFYERDWLAFDRASYVNSMPTGKREPRVLFAGSMQRREIQRLISATALGPVWHVTYRADD